MSHPVNPYITDHSVGNNPAFIGRTDILRDMTQMLHRPKDNAVVLYGQRCIGKTSVLQHLKAYLPTQGDYCPIYFDLQGKATWTVSQVINELAKSIALALNQTEPNFDSSPETLFQDTWLPNILQSLPENTTLVLLFDEFDVLTDFKVEQAGEGLFPYLRQLLDNIPQHLKLVLAMGRNIDDLDHIAVSLFKGIPQTKRLSLFNQEDTKKLVRLSETNNSLTWPDEAIECVWRYTQGHPFLTQQVCSQVWTQIYEKTSENVPTATPADVENVVFDVLDVSRKTLAWLWDGLPPAERVLASALAEAGLQYKSEQDLEKWLYESGVRVFIRELQEAPRLLQDWDLLESVEDSYRFRVELLRRWITENKPLRRIQAELDRIDPVADNFFRSAQELYQAGQLETAIKQLREAVGLNPNHLGAHQLLADILLAQGEAKEAKILMERLYHYQPFAARSRLIQALLELAQQTNNETKKIELYEQVLTLEPKQPEATAKSRELWQQRGETALAKADFKTALNIYQKLGINQKITEIEQEIRERYFDLIKQFGTLKNRKHYSVIILLTILALFCFGVWIDWGQNIEGLEESSLLPPLERFNGTNVLLVKELKQTNSTNVLLAKELEQANRENISLKKELEQAKQSIIQISKELVRVSQKTELGKFLLQLETGDQIVIVGSYSQQQAAKTAIEKLKVAYPELFYSQINLQSHPNKDNIYHKDNVWEIFISGFYSYSSARALKKKLLELELIEDAFIRKNPFPDRKL